MLTIETVVKAEPGVSERWSKEVLGVAASAAGLRKAASVTLVWAGDAEVRRLNRKHRGKDRTTDVLSFPLEGPGAWPSVGARELGDIVISVPEAKREAKRWGRKYRDELALLLVHGLLHILGHDHEKPGEMKRMFALQDKAMKRIGAGPETFFS